MIKYIKCYTFKIVLLGLVMISLNICTALFTLEQASIIDDIATKSLNNRTSIFFIVTFILMVALAIIQIVLTEDIYKKICISVKTNIIHKFFKKKVKDVTNKKSGEWLSFFTNTVNVVLAQHIYLSFYILQQVTMLIVSGIALCIANYKLGIMALIISLLTHYVVNKFSKKIQNKQIQFQRNNEMFTIKVTELLNSYEITHNYGIENFVIIDFENVCRENENYRLKYTESLCKAETTNTIGNLFIYLIVMIVGSYLAIKGLTGIGILVSVTELTYQLMISGTGLTSSYVRRKSVQPLVKKVRDILSEEDYQDFFQRNSYESLILDNVSFGYDDERLILNQVSLRLVAGKTYALVGESGEGKSTVLKLLMNHIIPKSGNIFLNNKEYKQMNENDIFNAISYISQSPCLFKGTLLDNITLFSDKYTEEEINRALDLAMLTDKDSNPIPKDYMIETNGKNISQGQKARISLARAILVDKPILLIDEMLASLDRETAIYVEKNVLGHLKQKKIILHVTHRVFDCSLYDEIYQLKNQKFMLTSGGEQ